MKRSRTISAILGLILVACAAVIFMDQNGLLGSQSATGPTISPTTPTEPVPSKPTKNNNSGYGDLK